MLPVAFGKVQSNGGAGAIQMVTHGDRFGKFLPQWLQPGDESQRFLINFQLFMVEIAIHSIKIRIRIKIRSRKKPPKS